MAEEKKLGKWDEMGSIGLNVASGFIQEAYTSELYWPHVSPLYNRIWRSDPEVVMARTVLGALASKLTVEFTLDEDIEKPSDDDKKAVDFGNEALEDVEGGISRWFTTCMERVPLYGWGWWEAVPGLRKLGWRPPNDDPWRSSFDDGRLGFRRLAFRNYSTFFSWDIDDRTGRVKGMEQSDPPNTNIKIPIDRSLHVVFGDQTNPEGVAALEAIWRLERIKFGLEMVQGIGFEHSAGYVKFTATDKLTAEDKANIKEAARAVLAAQPGNYLALPSKILGEVIDVPFGSAGAILEAIRYYGVLKLAILGMQWAAMGVLSPYGSYSAMADANTFFLSLFNSMAAGFVGQADTQIGKRLYEFNEQAFPNMTTRPVLKVDPAQKLIDLQSLAAFFTAYAAIAPLGPEDLISIRTRSEFLPETLPEIVQVPVPLDENGQPMPIPGVTAPGKEAAPGEEGTPGEEETPETAGDRAAESKAGKAISEEGGSSEEAKAKELEGPYPFEMEMVQLEEHSGVMVALYVPGDIAKELAVRMSGASKPEEMHITLAFLGDVKSQKMPRRALLSAVQRFASFHSPISGNVGGEGIFASSSSSGGRDVFYASYDSPDIPGLRQELVNSLKSQGFPPVDNHGFIPHITLAYLDPGKKPVLNPRMIDLGFDRISVVWGDEREDFILTGRNREEILNSAPMPMAEQGELQAKRPFMVGEDEQPTSVQYMSEVTEQDIGRALASFKKYASVVDPALAAILDAEIQDTEEPGSNGNGSVTP